MSVNRWIGSIVPLEGGFVPMVYGNPSDWLLGRLRQLTQRGFNFADLVDAVEFRDFMLGASLAPNGVERAWFGLETEARATEFAQRLAAGDGSGAPLGDRLALAIRLTREVHERGASQSIVDALKVWLNGMREGDISDFSSLQSVIGVIERQLPVSDN